MKSVQRRTQEQSIADHALGHALLSIVMNPMENNSSNVGNHGRMYTIQALIFHGKIKMENLPNDSDVLVRRFC